MHYGGCEVEWMNPKVGQWHTSPDVRRRNLIPQWPRSNNTRLGSSDKKKKKQPLKDYHDSDYNVKTLWGYLVD